MAGDATVVTGYGALESGAPRPVGPWALARRRLRRDRVALACGAVFVAILFAVTAGGPIAARLLGFERTDAARFSMLMAIPVIAAAAPHRPQIRNCPPWAVPGRMQPTKALSDSMRPARASPRRSSAKCSCLRSRWPSPVKR